MTSAPRSHALQSDPTHSTDAPPTSVSFHRVSTQDRLNQWADHHKKGAQNSLKHLIKHPAGSLLTIMVMALALALPFSLGLVTKNIASFNQHWDGELSISVYLKTAHTLTAQQLRKLANDWSQHAGVKSTKLISPDEALNAISEYSDAKAWVQELGSNPLPWVIVLIPDDQSESGLQSLSAWLSTHALVEDIQLDNQWVKRLNGIYVFLKAVFWILAIALGSTALIIVTNTMRLDVENRKEEIFVVRLVGGTDTFVRRPFLYTGFWYGLAGSLFALMLLLGCGLLVSEFIQEISKLYNSAWTLTGPDWLDIGSLLVCGTALGLAGAWIAVNKHLRNESAEEKLVY